MRNPIPKLQRPQVKYYSFWLSDSELRKDWILYDVKIPALSPYHAVCLYAFLRQFQAEKPNKKYRPTLPTLDMRCVEQIQRIVEYEKVAERGQTVVQFRRVKVHRMPKL